LTDDSNRRQYERIDICWPVTIYYDDEEIAGETENISAEGLYVCSEKPLPLNKVFSISIDPPEHQVFGAKGKVIWSDLYGIGGDENKDVYGIGICLVKISEEDKRDLEDVLMNYL